LTTELAALELELAFDLIDHLLGYTNPAPGSYAFEARCYVDAVPEDVALVFDDVADIDADSEFDPVLQRHLGVSFDHSALDFHGALHGIHRTCELDQHAVAGRPDDVPTMFPDLSVEQLASVRIQLGQRAFLIDAHESTVAGDIGQHDSYQASMDSLFGQVLQPASRRAV
jgi:hypothetical protein